MDLPLHNRVKALERVVVALLSMHGLHWDGDILDTSGLAEPLPIRVDRDGNVSFGDLRGD